MKSRGADNSDDQQSDVVVKCITDDEVVFQLEKDKASHHFSQNHYVSHELERQLDRHSIVSAKRDANNDLLGAELAVFSGNLLRAILGEPQPAYYLCEIADYNKKDKKYNRFNHPYFSVSDHVADYADWRDAVEVDEESGDVFIFGENIGDKAIRHLTAIVVAGHFLGELDWSDANFGLTDATGDDVAVRLDPCISFTDVFFKQDKRLHETLKNLLLNFIKKYNGDEERYLEEFIDHDRNKLKNSHAIGLFCNRAEILETIDKIINLNDERLSECVKKSFHPSHYPIADYLSEVIKRRRAEYEQAKALIKWPVEHARFLAEGKKSERNDSSNSSDSESDEPSAHKKTKR